MDCEVTKLFTYFKLPSSVTYRHTSPKLDCI